MARSGRFIRHDKRCMCGILSAEGESAEFSVRKNRKAAQIHRRCRAAEGMYKRCIVCKHLLVIAKPCSSVRSTDMPPRLTRVIECKLRKIEPRIVAHNGLKCFAVKFSLNCGIFGRCRPRFGGFGGDIDIPKRQKLRARADKSAEPISF